MQIVRRKRSFYCAIICYKTERHMSASQERDNMTHNKKTYYLGTFTVHEEAIKIHRKDERTKAFFMASFLIDIKNPSHQSRGERRMRLNESN